MTMLLEAPIQMPVWTVNEEVAFEQKCCKMTSSAENFPQLTTNFEEQTIDSMEVIQKASYSSSDLEKGQKEIKSELWQSDQGYANCMPKEHYERHFFLV